MTEQQDEPGVPLEVMRQVLNENRALVQLLSLDSCNHDVSTAPPGAASLRSAEVPSSLISTYRELVELLEIQSATSDAAVRAGDRRSGRLRRWRSRLIATLFNCANRL